MRIGGTAGLLAAALGWPSLARAFCGTYVGPAGEAPSNGESVLVLSMEQGRTVLTLANDFQGRTDDFGLLVPVPAGFDASAVSVADADALQALDAYSAPRLVSYTCEQVWDGEVVRHEGTYQSGCSGSGTSGGSTRPPAATHVDTGGLSEPSLEGVLVQSHASVGAYEVSVVSAEATDGLSAWLETNGMALPAESEPLVQELLDHGVWFVAATVSTDAVTAWLEPLQLVYDSEIRSLPLALGTSSSAGVQDLVLYTLAPSRVRITNYPEADIEDECLLSSPGAYEALVDHALDPAPADGQGRAQWATEYGWNAGKCDPCAATGSLDPEAIEALGWSSAAVPYVTRLRMRYGPDQIDEDVLLQLTGDVGTSQLRYVEHAAELEDLFPVCGIGWAADPGTCGEDPEVVAEAAVEEDTGGGCLCASVPTTASAGTLALLLAGIRRRRSTR